MSDSAKDDLANAAARLETAVDRLTQILSRHAASPAAEDGEMVPRAEVAAMAERLDATIARLRGALAEELRPEPPPGEPE
ncbi:hypothetical protein JMJ55_03690 [Belnapia sp. T6]|uniref:Uncharacterized protein n=1 Tax=Belnapia mucosa TaxID=2804532 RepID=A0ABS1UY68_9PROT|nr:hypothetical protein [Belnapia mucosa]MBL6454413.1 hypothetical protein [Belnapia mucosa]